jgi:hypothetical protein
MRANTEWLKNNTNTLLTGNLTVIINDNLAVEIDVHDLMIMRAWRFQSEISDNYGWVSDALPTHNCHNPLYCYDNSIIYCRICDVVVDL